MKSWIQSLEGRKLEPLMLTKEMVGSIEEIAHSLAGEFRFTRQTAKRYSVAEHCVRGAALMRPTFAGAFLLHELSEVYLPDIAGPLKPSISVQIPGVGITPWVCLERVHTHVILNALGLVSIAPLISSPEVKAMDLAMLAAEKRDLCGVEPEPWGLDVPPADVSVTSPWTPDVAEQQFLNAFGRYF